MCGKRQAYPTVAWRVPGMSARRGELPGQDQASFLAGGRGQNLGVCLVPSLSWNRWHTVGDGGDRQDQQDLLYLITVRTLHPTARPPSGAAPNQGPLPLHIPVTWPDRGPKLYNHTYTGIMATARSAHSSTSCCSCRGSAPCGPPQTAPLRNHLQCHNHNDPVCYRNFASKHRT